MSRDGQYGLLSGERRLRATLTYGFGAANLRTRL